MYYCSNALFDTWSELLKACVLEDEEPLMEWHGEAKNTDAFWLYLESFKILFETPERFEPIIYIPLPHTERIKNRYIDESPKVILNAAKKLLKNTPNKEYDVCYSFASYEVCNKGLTEFINIEGINLGDSRNFKSIEEIIEKVRLVQKSRLYVGTKCSWSRLASFFEVPTIRVIQDYPIMSFR